MAENYGCLSLTIVGVVYVTWQTASHGTKDHPSVFTFIVSVYIGRDFAVALLELHLTEHIVNLSVLLSDM
jgi:hypothetical protein